MKISLGHSKRIRRRRLSRRSIIIIAVAVAVLAIVGGYFIVYAKIVVSHATAAQAEVKKAQQQLADQDFDSAKISLSEATSELIATRGSLNRFSALSTFPYVKSQLLAARQIIAGGIITVQALADVADVAKSVLTPLTSKETISLASLSFDEKSQLIENISQAEPALIDIQSQLRAARAEFVAVPSKGLIGPLSRIQKEIEDKLPAFDQIIESALPLARVIPELTGHPDTATYLFLLENNSELRPTGGFIGTYGVIKIHEAEITTFETDNVYNLDSESDITVTPPLPLQQYIKADYWYLRDANWSPDFPTSAEKAIWFYQHEGGPVRDFDGVIAITPNVISSLLKVSGPIETDGITFTAENFEAELYHQVSSGFLRQGIAFEDRKDIIGNLGTILITRLLSLPQDRWPALWQSIITSLDEKQFLLYAKEFNTQTLLVEQGWSGSVTATDSDYLMVVDANMASLKSDPAVKRTISYRLEADQDQPTATASIEYRHAGTFDERTTRYRTYVRMYVPLGSSLSSSSGNDQEITTETELGKTVFGTFMSIEPGETETLAITYALAPEIISLLDSGAYSFIAQKQPGTIDHKLSVDLKFERDVKAVTPRTVVVDKKGVTYHTAFLTDQTIVIAL